MGHRFAEIAFTESVREVQSALGSRVGYQSLDEGEDHNHELSPREQQFIEARDSFYMASVGETGWPYVQHRGGPAGFMKVLDSKTIGFADFSGNRQYVSVGNFRKDDRVSLFFMDYPNQRRLKLLGRVRTIGDDMTSEEDSALLAGLEVDDYRARVERGFVIDVEAFDWNCPQHITPRYTEAEVEALVAPIREENARLRANGSTGVASGVLGSGPLELTVSGMRQLTPRIRAFELRDPKGCALPAVEAGAHLEVPVRLEDGSEAMRHYSICSDPARRDVYEIAVLREDGGAGGSRAVHESFALGLRLNCELPKNNFELHGDSRPAVLIAGGIGITPIRAMARALKARGTAMHLHYSARSEAEMAFHDSLPAEFGERISTYYTAEGRRLDLNKALDTAPENAIVYVCGSARLVAGVYEAAAELDFDSQRIRVERFTADLPVDAEAFDLVLARSGKRISVAADQSLLDAALDAGVDLPFSCRTGICGTCRVKVVGGEVAHHDSVLMEEERERDGMMCACVSRAKGECLAVDL